MSSATIKDVARLAGVSVSTASIALSGKGPVSERTKALVIDAAATLQYRPNAVARGLVTRRTNIVGLVIPDITDPYFHEITKGIQDVMAEEGFTVILADTDRTSAKALRAIDALKSHQVEGILLAGSGAEIRSAIGEGNEKDLWEGIHVVAIGPGHGDLPTVEVDNVHTGQIAATHVLEGGCRRIAIVSGPKGLEASELRLKGYIDTLKRHGISVPEDWLISGDFTPEGGYLAARRLLAVITSKENLPDAILAANDQMAVGVVKAVKEAGYEVPRDIAVIGIGDIPTATYVDPELTTVALPLKDMGKEAAALLLSFVRGDAPERSRIILDVQLIPRASTRAVKEAIYVDKE